MMIHQLQVSICGACAESSDFNPFTLLIIMHIHVRAKWIKGTLKLLCMYMNTFVCMYMNYFTVLNIYLEIDSSYFKTPTQFIKK